MNLGLLQKNCHEQYDKHCGNLERVFKIFIYSCERFFIFPPKMKKTSL